EVNNPLSYMLASLAFMRQQVDDFAPEIWKDKLEGFVAALEDAEDGVERVRNVVQSLLALLRIDSDFAERVDVREIVESAIRVASHHLRHVQVVRDLSDVPVVEAHPGRLGQVVLNLLFNAAQAVAVGRTDGSEIHVATRTDANGRVVIAVRDTGEGIS